MYGNKGRQRRPTEDSLSIERWLCDEAGDNSIQMQRLKRNLRRALEQELTPKQRLFVTMHYLENMSMTEIAREFGVNVSTVSRTVKRGKYRLEKCLQWSL